MNKKLTGFQKRVKRRVSAREHIFFIACPPGLKSLCLNEIRGLGFPGNNFKTIPGGIEFRGRTSDCMLLNLRLRTASRILMRIKKFKATSFRQLEKQFSLIDWDIHLPRNCGMPEVKAVCHNSRLYHSDAVAQRCKEVIASSMDKTISIPLHGTFFCQTVHIRADHDKFTVSLDTTGDLLFKRGIKHSVTKAPLRENLACAILFKTGLSKKDMVIDPMCGSGTFSIEAAMIQGNIPAGFFRSFAFEQWPGFSMRTWAYLKKQAEKNFTVFRNKRIHASDSDEAAVRAVRRNIGCHGFDKAIEVSRRDFFSIIPSLAYKNQKGVIVLNPPYGKRIDNTGLPGEFYREIQKKLVHDFRGWRAGIILPPHAWKFMPGLKLNMTPIFHGGLDLVAGCGRI